MTAIHVSSVDSNGPKRVRACLQSIACEKNEVSLSSHSIDLLEWLDDGVDSQGETYLEMRRRLVAYFDRRNRPFGRRAGRRDAQPHRAGRSRSRHDCHHAAGALLLRGRQVRPARGLPARARPRRRVDEARSRRRLAGRAASALVEPDEGAAIREQRLECLDRCLQELKPEQRELVVEYYRDTRAARRSSAAATWPADWASR